jgi:hypothetical protein
MASIHATAQVSVQIAWSQADGEVIRMQNIPLESEKCSSSHEKVPSKSAIIIIIL